MPNFSKKTQTDNTHLGNLTSARYLHVDGSVTTSILVRNAPGRLLRVVLNTNGATITLRNGTGGEVIGIIASDAPETTFNYGIYFNDSLRVQCGGAVDATIVYDI